MVRLEAGRALCRRAILRYVPETAVARYRRQLARAQEQAQSEIAELLFSRPRPRR